VDRWPDTEAKNAAYGVFKWLADVDASEIGAAVDDHGGIPYLRFADDAQDFFDAWFTHLEGRIRGSQEAACQTAHIAKYRSLLPSLSLLFHLLEVYGGEVAGPVSLRSTQRAAAWCEYLEAHARRVYQAAFEGDPEPAQRLAERLRESLPNPFTIREVVRKGWKSLDSQEVAEKAVAVLEDHGWVYAEEIPPSALGGRPTTVYHVNPRIPEGGES
jgi:hypothetical protein